MIEYSEDYLFALLFQLKGSVACKSLRYSVLSAIIALLLLLIEDWSPGFRQDYGFMDITNSQLWSASIGVLGILLAFRTNRAMARFWEGTGLLHQMRGEWFDSVSCCVTFSRAAVPTRRSDVMAFRHTIVRLMSLCHGSALHEIAGATAEDCETIDSFGLDNATLAHLKECQEVYHFNRVEVLLHLIQSLITANLDDGILKIPPPILSRVYQTLSRGFVNLLNAKKIADTRFPFPYVQLIALLLFVHVLLTPMMISSVVQSKVFAPLFTLVPLFGMFALNFIGVELENPFGDDDNDLPLDHFQAEMNKCLLMLLQENADLIPGVSPSRCIAEFDALKKSMRPSYNLGLPSASMMLGTHRRLSQFMDYVDVTEDENVVGNIASMVFRPTQKNRSGDSPRMTKRSRSSDNPRMKHIWSDARRYRAQVLEDMQDAAPVPPETPRRDSLEAGANPASEATEKVILESTKPEPKTLNIELLSNSIDTFSSSLDDLQKLAEAQADDLRRSITALAGFKQQLPVLLTTIPAEMRPSHWRLKAQSSVDAQTAEALEGVRSAVAQGELGEASRPAPEDSPGTPPPLPESLAERTPRAEAVYLSPPSVQPVSLGKASLLMADEALYDRT